VTRRNRVTPLGEIIAHPERGLVFGNRGCLHDDEGRIRRRYAGRLWISMNAPAVATTSAPKTGTASPLDRRTAALLALRRALAVDRPPMRAPYATQPASQPRRLGTPARRPARHRARRQAARVSDGAPLSQRS